MSERMGKGGAYFVEEEMRNFPPTLALCFHAPFDCLPGSGGKGCLRADVFPERFSGPVDSFKLASQWFECGVHRPRRFLHLPPERFERL